MLLAIVGIQALYWTAWMLSMIVHNQAPFWMLSIRGICYGLLIPGGILLAIWSKAKWETSAYYFGIVAGAVMTAAGAYDIYVHLNIVRAYWAATYKAPTIMFFLVPGLLGLWPVFLSLVLVCRKKRGKLELILLIVAALLVLTTIAQLLSVFNVWVFSQIPGTLLSAVLLTILLWGFLYIIYQSLNSKRWLDKGKVNNIA